MKKINKVVIYGTGFMGASLAKDIKSKSLAKSVCGIARNESRAEDIKKMSIFDEVTSSLEKALSNADLLVLSMPLASMLRSISLALDDYFKNNPDSKIIVTDLGSVKACVIDTVESSSLKNRFIGSHPICGSEKSGACNSVEGLYSGAPCIIINSDNKEALTLIKHFWKSVGCKISTMTANKHDKILAYSSHLPHLMSFAYSNIVDSKYFQYAAGSFDDMTRISKSDADVWNGILFNNKKEIVKASKKYIKNLKILLKRIEEGKSVSEYVEKINKKIQESKR